MKESFHENLAFNNDNFGNSSTAFSYEVVDKYPIYCVSNLGQQIHNKKIHL